jgi:hypothetical protein
MTRLKKTLLTMAASILLAAILWSFYQTRAVFLTIEQSSGQKMTIKLSRLEVRALESFFRHIICCDQWAYTLFGYKPVSFGGNTRFFSSFASLFPLECCMRDGWKVWQKIQLPHPHFAIWSEPASWSEDTNLLFIANRNSVSEILNTHIQDFQALTLRKFDDVTDLLQDIPEKSLARDILKGNETLLGILLGYGRENSYLFCDLSAGHHPIVWDIAVTKPIIDRCFSKLLTFRNPDIADIELPLEGHPKPLLT